MEDERGYLLVPHEPDCDGCLMVVERGEMAEIKRNFAVIDRVPLERARRRVYGIHFSGGSSFSVRRGNQVIAYPPISRFLQAANQGRS
jgi:hypothetical protein